VIKFIKSLFFSSPGEKIKRLRDQKYEKAVQLQRDGKLREYAKLMKEIEDLENQYIEVISENR
jgi:hypothetical protein